MIDGWVKTFCNEAELKAYRLAGVDVRVLPNVDRLIDGQIDVEIPYWAELIWINSEDGDEHELLSLARQDETFRAACLTVIRFIYPGRRASAALSALLHAVRP